MRTSKSRNNRVAKISCSTVFLLFFGPHVTIPSVLAFAESRARGRCPIKQYLFLQLDLKSMILIYIWTRVHRRCSERGCTDRDSTAQNASGCKKQPNILMFCFVLSSATGLCEYCGCPAKVTLNNTQQGRFSITLRVEDPSIFLEKSGRERDPTFLARKIEGISARRVTFNSFNSDLSFFCPVREQGCAEVERGKIITRLGAWRISG